MKRSNILPVVLVILAMICFSIAFSSCGVMEAYLYTPPRDPDPIYTKWRAEQKAQNEALLKYTQSAEFKRKYGGTSKSDTVNSPAAPSVVGTKNDPLGVVRNTPIGMPVEASKSDVTIRVRD